MTHKDFLRQINETIVSRKLLPSASDKNNLTIIVALSGGADSVALLRALIELGYRCEAAHCNFHLRGAESDRDATFVAELCQHLGVMLHKRDFDTKNYAIKHGVSIEMAAREQRYDFFHEIASGREEMRIAIAHHRNDNAETVMLNLIRGTGLRGLCGIPYQNGIIIRPMLDVTRQDVLDYLGFIEQSYINDSSNAIADVKRNIIRLRLMPLLEEINPNIVETLIRNAENARDAQDFITQHAIYINKVEEADGNIVIRKADIGHSVLLFELLRPYGFTSAQIDDIWHNIDGQPGSIWHSPTHNVLRDRENLVLQPTISTPNLPTEEDRIFFVVKKIEDIDKISTDSHTAMLDADKTGSNLAVRHVKEGDRFIPYGMTGSKLVSRYMIDHKFSAFQKERQLVVCNDAGIVWLVGQRIDNRYKIVEGKTRRVLILSTKNDHKSSYLTALLTEKS